MSAAAHGGEAPGHGPAKARPAVKAQDALAPIEARLAKLESGLAQVQRNQHAQFMQLMKFSILRHLSMMALIVDQGQAPPRIAAQVRQRIDEAAKQIAEAKQLDRVREVDVRLQRELRQIIATFKQS